MNTGQVLVGLGLLYLFTRKGPSAAEADAVAVVDPTVDYTAAAIQKAQAKTLMGPPPKFEVGQIVNYVGPTPPSPWKETIPKSVPILAVRVGQTAEGWEYQLDYPTLPWNYPWVAEQFLRMG